jgi:integrator complex subunit 11
MLNDYWERMNCDCPILYASQMGHRATAVYKKCIRWMNSTVQTGFYDLGKQTYNFSKVAQHGHDAPVPTPCVMVATSGMLSNGPVLDFLIRYQWYADPRNLIVFPGYCGERTLGRAILERGPDNKVVWDSPDGRHIELAIRCKIERISFSAHADQFEILTMCERLRPREVIAVHGDREAVGTLATRISEDLGIRTHVPELEQKIAFDAKDMIPVEIDRSCASEGTFEGAVKMEGGVWKIVELRKAAAEFGSTVSVVGLKRKIKTKASFEEVLDILRNLKLIGRDFVVIDREVIQTKDLVCEFVEGGLLLTYDIRGRNAVNTFGCLLSRQPFN